MCISFPVIKSTASIINEYQEPIADILKIALGMFADGFAVQKGALFGFGPQAWPKIQDRIGITI